MTNKLAKIALATIGLAAVATGLASQAFAAAAPVSNAPTGTISGLNGGGLMPQQRRAIEERNRRLQEQRLRQQAGPASFETGHNTVKVKLTGCIPGLNC
jgi:hypothetical protein